MSTICFSIIKKCNNLHTCIEIVLYFLFCGRNTKSSLNFAYTRTKVQDQGVDPNLRDGDGATPLHFAASRGHLSVVRWLLKHGAKLSLDKYGKSPINDAAENQQVEVRSSSLCRNLIIFDK